MRFCSVHPPTSRGVNFRSLHATIPFFSVFHMGYSEFVDNFVGNACEPPALATDVPCNLATFHSATQIRDGVLVPLPALRTGQRVGLQVRSSRRHPGLCPHRPPPPTCVSRKRRGGSVFSAPLPPPQHHRDAPRCRLPALVADGRRPQVAGRVHLPWRRQRPSWHHWPGPVLARRAPAVPSYGALDGPARAGQRRGAVGRASWL